MFFWLLLLQRTMGLELTLYTHKMCPFAQRAAIALEASCLEYASVEVNLYGSGGFSKNQLKAVEASGGLDAKGYIPILRTGKDDVLRESIAIVDRIAAVDTTLQPADPFRAAQAVAACGRIEKEGKRLVLEGARSTSAKLQNALAEIDGMLVEDPYLAGPALSTADAILFPFLWRLDEHFKLDLPHLAAYLDRMQRHPPVQRTLSSSWWWWW